MIICQNMIESDRRTQEPKDGRVNVEDDVDRGLHTRGYEVLPFTGGPRLFSNRHRDRNSRGGNQ